MLRSAFFLVVILLETLFCSIGWAGETSSDYTDDSLIGIGRSIYMNGISSSGKPINAIVQGDVRIDGSLFTCGNCHLRSGFGGYEGNRTVPPVTGPTLFSERSTGYRDRPAYTDAGLARVIRTGIRSTGLPTMPLMPKYELSQGDMNALIAYLKVLSSFFSPGVDDQEIHFACVLDRNVDESIRLGIIRVISTFFEFKNRLSRRELDRRQQEGPHYFGTRYYNYRKWKLHIWEVSGESSSWKEQLIGYYSAQPVFALLSGMTGDDWTVVHDFCEENEIPCLLPNTDSPPLVDEGAFYTRYFSKGIALEAEAILKSEKNRNPAGKILQIYRLNSLGETAANQLENQFGNDRSALISVPLNNETILNSVLINAMLTGTEATAAVLWLSADDLKSVWAMEPSASIPNSIYISSILTDINYISVPEKWCPHVHIAHFFRLEEDFQKRSRRIKSWMDMRQIEITNPRIQYQTYYACYLAGEGLMNIYTNFYRDYFIDSIDHIQGFGQYSANYPRLSFGPGQIYLEKGCYILNLESVGGRTGVKSAEWIVP